MSFRQLQTVDTIMFGRRQDQRIGVEIWGQSFGQRLYNMKIGCVESLLDTAAVTDLKYYNVNSETPYYSHRDSIGIDY